MITGGNSGIGWAAAIEFAKQDAKVVVSGRREKEGHEVVAEIKALGGEAIFVKTDVSKAGDVKAMIEQTLAKFRRLDFASTMPASSSCSHHCLNKPKKPTIKLCTRCKLPRRLSVFSYRTSMSKAYATVHWMVSQRMATIACMHLAELKSYLYADQARELYSNTEA